MIDVQTQENQTMESIIPVDVKALNALREKHVVGHLVTSVVMVNAVDIVVYRTKKLDGNR